MRLKHGILSLLAFIILSSFSSDEENKKPLWMSFEQAVTSAENGQKKIFIDVYTDWCGWCKKMDAATFSKAEVADYLNDKFYSVKLNAEQREDINFDGHTFKFIEQGRRGYHQLAAALLKGKMSYPSVVILNEKFEIIQVLPGYRGPDEFLQILKFIGDDHYLNTPYEEYKKQQKG